MCELPSVNNVIVSANIIVMSEEIQKQIKLTQVYNELQAIKTQLHQLIQPTSNNFSQEASSKLTFNKYVSPLLNPKTDQTKLKRIDTGKIYNNLAINKIPIVSKHSHSPCQLRKMNSPSREQKINQWRTGIENITGSLPNQQEKRINSSLKSVKKVEDQPYRTNFQLTTLSKKANNGNPMSLHTNPFNQKKKGIHGRYNSQVYQMKSEELNLSGTERTKQKQFIDMERLGQKKYFVLNKNMNIVKSNNSKTKRLKRVRSDFTGVPQRDTSHRKIQPLSMHARIKQLQDELHRKEDIIEVLSHELLEIDKNFRQIETNLFSILNYKRSQQSNVKEITVNTALEEILIEIEMHKKQSKRLSLQCDRLQKQTNLQEAKINQDENLLSELNKQVQNSLKLKNENIQLKQQIESLQTKLKIAVNENELKDEFITKFLLGRSGQQLDVEWVVSTLQNFLKGCGQIENEISKKPSKHSIIDLFTESPLTKENI